MLKFFNLAFLFVGLLQSMEVSVRVNMLGGTEYEITLPHTLVGFEEQVKLRFFKSLILPVILSTNPSDGSAPEIIDEDNYFRLEDDTLLTAVFPDIEVSERALEEMEWIKSDDRFHHAFYYLDGGKIMYYHGFYKVITERAIGHVSEFSSITPKPGCVNLIPESFRSDYLKITADLFPDMRKFGVEEVSVYLRFIYSLWTYDMEHDSDQEGENSDEDEIFDLEEWPSDGVVFLNFGGDYYEVVVKHDNTELQKDLGSWMKKNIDKFRCKLFVNICSEKPGDHLPDV
jgi:hypothetical protein